MFAELVISSEDALIKAMFLTEGQLATTDGNVPKYAEKDFDVVAVAKYYNEDGTGKSWLYRQNRIWLLRQSLRMLRIL